MEQRRPDTPGYGHYGMTRHALNGPCETCGHQEWHHTGTREPGCTYLGTCCCPAFRTSIDDMPDPAEVAASLEARATQTNDANERRIFRAGARYILASLDALTP